jgi:two-component system sensor histidine kinase/response regulator
MRDRRFHGEVFNRARFLASVDGNLEALHEIAQLFLEDCCRRLSALDDALARRDRAALESAAHMLKGSAGYIGAERMFAAAEAVEAMARRDDLAQAHGACARLARATMDLADVLAADLRAPDPGPVPAPTGAISAHARDPAPILRRV